MEADGSRMEAATAERSRTGGRAPLVYLLDLRDDPVLIARYKAWHAPGAVPDGVIRSFRAAGVEELEIFLCGNRLVMLLWPGADFDPRAEPAADPAVQQWEALMDRFQQRLPFAETGAKWVPATRIFALGEHVAAA